MKSGANQPPASPPEGQVPAAVDDHSRKRAAASPPKGASASWKAALPQHLHQEQRLLYHSQKAESLQPMLNLHKH